MADIEYEEFIDKESASERFMGNNALFSKFLFQFPERSLFSDLEKQIQDGDAAAAFESAHAMKGIIGNLSLKKLQPTLFSMVETLRKGELPAESEWNEFAAAYGETVEVIQKMQAEGTELF